MPRLTVTISDEHERILEEHSNGEAFRSKSEVVRECIEAHERVDELSNQLTCLEAEVNMLRDQRRQLKEKAARVDELETKLRKLQMEYHTLISEGKSPTELEPKLDTSLATDPKPTIELETTDSEATGELETTDSEATGETEATTESAAVDAVAPTRETAEKAETSRTPETTRTAKTNRDTRLDSDSVSTATNEAETSGTDSGGVEIDEELLYQSPGVGTRLKAALFGGPGGSR